MADAQPSNLEVADRLERVAELLELEEANPFRVRSYRRAADEVRALQRPVAGLYDEGGTSRLQSIEGVGERLAGSIAEIVETGRLGLLDRLESEISPAAVFERLPGIGPELAGRIRDELGIGTLEELERAAYDGRLEAVEGIGPKRVRGIRDALAGMLGRSSRRRARQRLRGAAGGSREPPVALLLDVDSDYRRRARDGVLRRIAPRRFNPDREAWLPIMEVKRDGWEMRALFSNTRRAHELGRTHDWVVIYYDDDGQHGQCTVVTARSGPLAGSRVVRGREAECRRHYRSTSS
jgi:DNA polymerase (family 10)